jgi:glycogen phosphorylase
MHEPRTVAYFSMEIALDPAMPTYSGGLGVLAGDTIRSAADLRVPMVAVTLVHRKGYFNQKLDPNGWQHEEPVVWKVQDFVEELPVRAAVTLEGRTVQLRAWKYDVTGLGGFKVPVYFLDTDLPENSQSDRTLSDYLYGEDQRYRLCQEVVLGMGGVRMLRALGYQTIRRFHLNEGHASLLTLALLDEEGEQAGRAEITPEDIQAVREKCVFTTHTPVPAGHDQFSMDLVSQVLGHRREFSQWKEMFCCEGRLNMTYLALSLSHYVNGVAKKHGEVSRLMYAGHTIDSITNGVHAATWVTPPFQALYDRRIPGWREDNFSLRYAISLPREEVWTAHLKAKQDLILEVNRATGAGMEEEVLTVGFARRASLYKRADLLFQDSDRLAHIATQVGRLQMIYAGKAHPQDQGGKELIQRVIRARDALRGRIRIAYLEDYDMTLGRLITSGVDVWLNTPQPPQEASGTSGMKAALNGVPSLSILDGWWIEGHIEGLTGWGIGDGEAGDHNEWARDAASLYDKLEQAVLPLFYHDRDRFIDVMRHCIALNGSFFNTQRMVQEYVVKAYR